MPTVLVTRPRHQQLRFIELCTSLGLKTHTLPLLRILPKDVDNNLWQSQFNNPSIAWIFTSRNAVEHCPFDSNPEGSIFAMGESTAQALTSSGRTLSANPQVPFNSEALVKQLASVNAKSAVVVTGVGGRAYLGKELRSMDWQVTEVRCYQRIAEEHSERSVTEALTAADILSLTSIESMDVLLKLAQHETTDWQTKPLVVNSERAVVAAKKSGFTGDIHIAYPAGDAGQIEAIEKLLDKL